MSRLLLVFLASFILVACQSVSEQDKQIGVVESEPASGSNSTGQGLVEGETSSTPMAVDVPAIDSLYEDNATEDAENSEAEEALVANAAVETETKVEQVEETDPVIIRLLGLGNDALSREALLSPEDDNANMYYQIVLGRDPSNKAAQEGLSHIVYLYTDWALEKAKRGQYGAAEKFLESAEFVNAKDSRIAEARKTIADWRRGKGRVKPKVNKKPVDPNKFDLPANLFSYQDEVVLEYLQPIIDRVTKTQASIDIYWPRDKEARLLYRIINSRTETFRVRAMIYHRSDYKVVLKPQ